MKKDKKYKYTFTSLLMKTGIFKKDAYADAFLVAFSVSLFVASGFILWDSPVVRSDIENLASVFTLQD